MKDLRIFLKDIGSSISFSEQDVLKINTKRYFVSDDLKEVIIDKNKVVYAGRYLGKKKREFVPSFILLDAIAKENVNKVHVDAKTAWLFACGRDIFERSILNMEGELEDEALFLVMFDDYCLGYVSVDLFEGKRILINELDRGDFLRRER